MFSVYSKPCVLSVRRVVATRSVVITRNKKDNKLLQLREKAYKRRRQVAQRPSESGSDRRDGARPRESAASLWLRKDRERQIQQQNSELGQNIKKLQEFTDQLKKTQVKEREDRLRKELAQEMDVIEDPNKLIEQDVETLVNGLLERETARDAVQLPATSSSNATSLFEYIENEALTKLPPMLIDKLGASVKFIRDKRTASWELLFKDLKATGGMKNMNERDVAKLMINVPRSEKAKVVPLVDEMMQDAGITKDLLVYNLFLTAYASDAQHLPAAEALFEEMRVAGIVPDLYTFSSLVKAQGLADDLTKVNRTLELMHTNYGLHPNKQIYTSVLQTCVRLGDHSQATEVFDAMKFLSQSTQPDARAYESIVLSTVEDDNIEKGLDLYDEMLTRQPKPVKPSPHTLLMLARGCTSRSELFHRGWEFIFEYYDAKYEPNATMLETMMHLAAKDGDASFTRALFNTLMESKANNSENYTPSPVSISLLMLSYANFRFNHTPVTMLDDRVKLLRARTIDVTNFNFDPPRSPPFLPIDYIISDKSIIAESNAIWAYVVLNFPDFIDTKAVGSYLYAATSRGDSIDEFIRRFDSITFLDESGLLKESQGTPSEPEVIIEEDGEEISDDPLEQALKTVKSEPPALQLSFASNFKIARTSEFYNIAIVAAKNFKDLSFATRIWTERGQFRKTDAFKNLSQSKRSRLDFEFAQYMLSFFTEMGLLEDATMIVLSTQNQFNWEWNHVKPTYALAETSGNEDVKSFLSKAVNNKNYQLRPQYNYVHPSDR